MLVYFRNGQPAWFERIRYPLRYEQIVRGHARNYDLDPALVAAVIYQESKFHANAKSSSGAIGLMQLTPQTAEGIAIRTGGSQVPGLRSLQPGDQRALRLVVSAPPARQVRRRADALAAYNAGQHNVDEWRAEGKGIQFPETRAYVHRVEHLKHVYARAYDL